MELRRQRKRGKLRKERKTEWEKDIKEEEMEGKDKQEEWDRSKKGELVGREEWAGERRRNEGMQEGKEKKRGCLVKDRSK